MKASDEFYDFCAGMHQDIDLYGPEPRDWIDGALGAVRKERLTVFRDYLNELLTGDYSDHQLSELYHSASPEMGITSGIRYFLEMARDTIDSTLQPGGPNRIDLARQALLQRLRDAD